MECTAPLSNCRLDAASLTMGQGASQPDTILFDAQNTSGTGAVKLRATHTPSGTSNDGWIDVTINLTLSWVADGTSHKDGR